MRKSHSPVNGSSRVLPVPEDEVDTVPGAWAGADVTGQGDLATLHCRHHVGRTVRRTRSRHWHNNKAQLFKHTKNHDVVINIYEKLKCQMDRLH